jgi:hypothetical protein
LALDFVNTLDYRYDPDRASSGHFTMPTARLEVRMESPLPFLKGSFIPYNMPVYPGARRIGQPEAT